MGNGSQGPQVMLRDCNDILFGTSTIELESEDSRKSRKLKATGKYPEEMTHIIFEAEMTRHDDAPAAKLQDEKSRCIEWHDGWEWGRIFPPLPVPSGCFYLSMDPTAKTGKNEAARRTGHLLYPMSRGITLLCSFCLRLVHYNRCHGRSETRFVS
jgi:hypothetical protein